MTGKRTVHCSRGMLRVGLLLGLAAFNISVQAGDAASHCLDFSNVSVPDVRITRSTPVLPAARGVGIPAQGAVRVPFCRVEGEIEGDIGFELWLPDSNHWNQRLLSGGVGGQAGTFSYPTLLRGVNRGYASASTDTGHKVTDTHWLLKGQRQAENYAERANHLLAVKTKALIQSFYGRTTQHAFFVGCSGGGRQAMTEVQRYPDDYDGVIAGAPGVNTPEMSARRLWEMQMHTRWGRLMQQRDWDLVARASRQACDGTDGAQDGLVENPAQCRFDPASLACNAGTTKDCLSTEQIEAVRTLHAPLRDENGKTVDRGLPYGIRVSADALPEPFTPGPRYLAVVLFSEGVYRDPHWDPAQFRIARDLARVDQVMNLHADNPDVDRFRSKGGKLIMYQGWSDPLVSAYSTVDYFDALTRRYGALGLAQFSKLYMVPGMAHCRGGDVPDQFGGMGDDAPLIDARHDMLSALESWVLQGQAPREIVASQLQNATASWTRPLCPYPQQAHYKGEGSVLRAESHVCR